MGMWDLLVNGGSFKRAAERVGVWVPGYELRAERKHEDKQRTIAYRERLAFLEVWAIFAGDVRNGFERTWKEWKGERKVEEWLVKAGQGVQGR
jgi:hypothetical protein